MTKQNKRTKPVDVTSEIAAFMTLDHEYKRIEKLRGESQERILRFMRERGVDHVVVSASMFNTEVYVASVNLRSFTERLDVQKAKVE